MSQILGWAFKIMFFLYVSPRGIHTLLAYWLNKETKIRRELVPSTGANPGAWI